MLKKMGQVLEWNKEDVFEKIASVLCCEVAIAV